MTGLPHLEPSEFAAFFHAVHGKAPFPWQERLLRRIVDSDWPRLLDLPTGTGKTAALDAAVFALALEARRVPRRAPLRIIYVVDRRTIVDQAHERAKTIQERILTGQDDILGRVRERLASFSADGMPLVIALMRGGIARDDLWARTPDQPLIAVSTVDQVGSRLLFRGYGVSDSMKPVHAGLLGCDVLYLLDEVHLSQPFRETLEAIAGRYRSWAERPIPGGFVVVEMSATPAQAAASTPFGLDEADRNHPVLAARLRAPKPASLVLTNARGFPREVEQHVLAMLDRPGATIAVVVNRVNSARELHTRLCEVVPVGPDRVHLLTGRMRSYDRDLKERELLDRIRAGRVRRPDDEPIVVVATQSIEAGADFDFDGLVAECASLDALRQRFGRLDRLGDLQGAARGVIVARADTLTDDPVYGKATGRTWDWLQTWAESLNFGIDALQVPPNASELGLLAPRAQAPVLLPGHLDAWVQTAPTPYHDPDVSLWLHGPERGVADVQIVWRADLSEQLLRAATVEVDEARTAADVAIGMVEALPPVSAEAMPVPFLAAKRWLQRMPEPQSFDVEGARIEEEEQPKEPIDAQPRAVVVWRGEQSAVVPPSALRPGDTIVVPSSYGGIAHGNWTPAAQTAVPDVAEVAALGQGRRPTLRLHPAVVHALLGPEAHPPLPGDPDLQALDDRETVRDWLDDQATTPLDDGARELIEGLRADRQALRVERLPLGFDDEVGGYFVIRGRRRSGRGRSAISIDEQTPMEGFASSFTGTEVTLADHQAGVARRVADLAARLGVAEDVTADLRVAGEWHDAGKADLRFQRWLHGGSEFKTLMQREPLAKGSARLSTRPALRTARERAAYPAGARHELASVALMESASEALSARAGDWTLVQHLVASHHGECRPLAPWVRDPNPVDVRFMRDGYTYSASSAHALARLDSGVAERFWAMVRRYGWWGSAWLEALLRLADHRQSEWEQAMRETTRA